MLNSTASRASQRLQPRVRRGAIARCALFGASLTAAAAWWCLTTTLEVEAEDVKGVTDIVHEVTSPPRNPLDLRTYFDLGQTGFGLLTPTPEPLPGDRKSSERVCGVDQRTQVTNTTTFPYTTICSLTITFPNGGTYIGSGAMIGPGSVLTAGHCVYDKNYGGWAKSIKVIPARNGTKNPYGSQSSAKLITNTTWTSSAATEYDYGMIILPDTTLGSKTGSLGYAARSDSQLQNLTVNIPGYPSDKTSGTMWKMSGPITALAGSSKKLLNYSMDTYGGQSGSPVIQTSSGKYYVVGIHTGVMSDSPCVNRATRLDSSVYDFIVRNRK